MREIKFRAWDTEDRKIRDVIGMNFYRDYDATVAVDIGEGKYLQDDAVRFEIMQNTGLKDKNGTEIYEGDIIRGPYNYGPGGFFEIEVPVKYHVIYGYQLHYFLMEQTEIIGNIYEHPHLLEAE